MPNQAQNPNFKYLPPLPAEALAKAGMINEEKAESRKAVVVIRYRGIGYKVERKE